MIKKESVYRIGRIGKTHGVDGELTFMFDDDVFYRREAEYLILDIDGILVPFFIDDCRMKSSATALVRFENIGTQERARQLTGCEVYIPRHSAEDADETLSAAEMIGFEVHSDHDDSVIGTITAVDESTINPLFEVVRNVDDTLLLPAAADLITEIDSEQRVVTMQLIEGLLDLNEKKK